MTIDELRAEVARLEKEVEYWKDRADDAEKAWKSARKHNEELRKKCGST